MGFTWKKLGKVLNKIKSPLATGVGFALGGPAGAAAANALASGIGHGKPKLSRMAAGAVQGGVAGLTAGSLGAVGGKGFSALGSSLKTMATNPSTLVRGATGAVGGRVVPGAVPGASAAPTGAVDPGAPMGAGGGAPGRRFGVQDLIQLGSAGAGVYGGMQAERRANAARQRGDRMQDRALEHAEGAYAERAPLRALGVRQLTAPEDVDVREDFATSNPMARRYRRLSA